MQPHLLDSALPYTQHTPSLHLHQLEILYYLVNYNVLLSTSFIIGEMYWQVI